jgi:glucosamine 6-phosphate synthetase-like amidotransferase/phosphosugar isomerase protein
MRRSAVVSEQHSQEQQTESAIKVRQVTDVHANWSHQGELEHGKFSYQLILDDGAQETVIMPTADDAKVLRDLFDDADTVYWDTEREVLIFGKID